MLHGIIDADLNLVARSRAALILVSVSVSGQCQHILMVLESVKYQFCCSCNIIHEIFFSKLSSYEKLTMTANSIVFPCIGICTCEYI